MALRLFAERGYEAVTVSDVAEAAEVAKATLFTYFPTKDALVLDGVADDDLAGIVARRPPGRSPLDALRAHYRAAAATEAAAADFDALVTRVRVILDSPTLAGAVMSRLDRQRHALALELTEAYGEPAAAIVAAQIVAACNAVRELYLQRLRAGASSREAGRRLAEDVELAFDLLQHGCRPQEGR